jgi:signal transduction histidine kinase
MRHLWPQTIVGRAVLVLFLALAVSNLLGLAIYVKDRSDALTAAGGRHVAERIAAIATAVDEAPTRTRPQLVASMRGAGLHVTWSEDSAVADTIGADWRLPFVRAALRDFLGDIDSSRIRIAYRQTTARELWGERPPRRGFGRGSMHRRHMMFQGPAGPLLHISLQLGDQSWLNFVAPFVRFKPFWSASFFPFIVATALVVIAVSVWAVRRAAAPLALFAQAAERLGLDVNAPAVSEAGPREVNRAARAFNDMQRRLQSLIRDRTQMLAAISHDLRTPITRLRLRAEFVDDAQQQAKMLADLEEMEAMIAATLAFARDDHTQEARRPVDLAGMLQSLCDDRSDAGGAAAYEGPDKLIYTGRPTALKRAFANLIDNAIHYGSKAAVRLEGGGGGITVRIEDDGPGLPEGELEMAFQPFYRVEASRSRETGGTGLGLAVVRSVVRAHGGEVTLANRDAGGLTATVTLPDGEGGGGN